MAKKETLLEKAKQELLRIERQNGFITPEVLVAESSSISSPLHSYFQWDDSKAGEAYRRWQARELIKEVTVSYSGREINGFYNVRIVIKGQVKQGYVSLVKVLSNTDLRRQVLRDALNEIRYWETKYKEYQELIGIIDRGKVVKLEKRLE